MIWPPWARPAGIGAAVLVVAVLLWVWWPVSTPIADQILEQQAVDAKKEADAAKAEAEAAKAQLAGVMARNALLEEELRETLAQIPEVRERRRAARTETRARVGKIRALPDADVRPALVEQHARTRAAIERFRAGERERSVTNGGAGATHP